MAKVCVDPVTGQLMNAYGMFSGLEPERLTGTTGRLRLGSCSDRSGYGWSTPYVTQMDLTKVGVTVDPSPPPGTSRLIGGRDQPTPFGSGDSIQIYTIRENDTDELTALYSKSIYYGDVIVPSGYTMVDKHRFGFRYDSDWGGIPAFHLSNGPTPTIWFTQAQDDDPWRALAGAYSTPGDPWLDLDLSKWLPDAARFVHIKTRTHPGPAGSTSGSAYVRVIGDADIGYCVGSVLAPPNGVNEFMEIGLRVSSLCKIQYRILGGARLTIVVRGYDMSEPS